MTEKGSKSPGRADPASSPGSPGPQGTDANGTSGPTPGSPDTQDWTPDELRRISDELAEEFPPSPTRTALALMDVDPHHLHAYWNITPEDLDAARRRAMGESAQPQELVLRVLEAPANEPAASVVELEVHGLNGYRLVDLWSEGGPYLAEIGLRAPDGAFTHLARSDAASPPVAGLAATGGQEDLDVSAPAPPRSDKAPRAEGAFPDTGPGEPRALPATVSSTPLALGTTAPPGDPSNEAATETGRRDPTLNPEAGQADAAFPGAGPGSAPPAGGAEATPVPVALGEAEPPTAAQPSLSLQGYGPPAPGAEPVSLGEAPGPQEVMALDHPWVTYSSSAVAGAPPDLEVHVELHVHGRARPGSRLELFGRRVRLGPDGSFSVRRELPEGAVAVPIVYHPEGPERGDDDG